MTKTRTLYINLFAGPGSGKSTTAAKVFAMLKEQHVHAELNSEYVKRFAHRGQTPVSYDQFYFFAKQIKQEYELLGKLDVVVCDAPSLIACYYTHVYGEKTTAEVFKAMYKEYRRMLVADGAEFFDIFLTRQKQYQPKGRFQTEQEARDIDVDMRKYLGGVGISLTEVPGDEHAAEVLSKMTMAHLSQSGG